MGEKPYGEISMTILKFAKFFGNLGQTKNELWGQIWFVAESGELPEDVVYFTYIKTRSLDAFNRLIIQIQARGVEPAEGIFRPKFIKHSASHEGRPTSYYSLDWTWEERSDWTTIEKASLMLSDPENLLLMNDFVGSKEMVNIDNLDSGEIACLMETRSSSSKQIMPADNAF